jgi:hypothetical protein
LRLADALLCGNVSLDCQRHLLRGIECIEQITYSPLVGTPEFYLIRIPRLFGTLADEWNSTVHERDQVSFATRAQRRVFLSPCK